MNIAVRQVTELRGPSETWQAANVVAYCIRMSATITPKQCAHNKQRSAAKYGDYRCYGCGGLSNQDEQKQDRRNRGLIRALTGIIETSEANNKADHNSIAETGISALDNIIDDLYTNPLPGDDFSDIELDLDDEQLLALFPEFSEEDDEADFPPLAGRQGVAPRRAVFRGRCKRCGGYMDNTREGQDDNVFHCLACGWRTGPEYERNRTMQTAGGYV